MADIVTSEVRSRMMRGIRGKDTKPELVLRKLLFGAGLRFRLHGKDLPGKPDIVLPKWNTIIFVHGCFWHRHEGCPFASTPGTRIKFWQQKFDDNVLRDAKNRDELLSSAWRVATVWECGLKEEPDRVVSNLLEWVKESIESCAEFPLLQHPSPSVSALPGAAGHKRNTGRDRLRETQARVSGLAR